MLHVISTRCVARDLHTIVPGPLEHAYWETVRGVVRRLIKSQIAPLNAIIIIIIIINDSELTGDFSWNNV